MGVPVAFALMAGVLVACMLTPISMQSMIGQMFHGIDSEILLAVPFFLLVGELMTSADVTNRMIRLAQTMVGHLRGGLAQVVTLFSMFFAGISGSSTADVAVLSRTVAPEMTKEGYDRAFTAALIACASTMANLIPPSIMAVVYGATGNVSIGGLFLAGIVPGVLIGIGLMIYSHFFGPVGIRKPRAALCEFADAARGSVLPLMIPLIIMGGILTGWFTPTEAGMVASVYILVVLIPLLNRRPHPPICRATSSTPGCSIPCRWRWSPAASAFGWMLAYLRGPDIVSGWIELVAGHRRPHHHAAAGAAVHHHRRLHGRGAGDHHLHADHHQAQRARQTSSRCTWAWCMITTLVFGLITPPYGLSLLVASKFVGVRVQPRDVRVAADLRGVLHHHRLHGAVPRRRALSAEAAPAGVGRLLQEPDAARGTSVRSSAHDRHPGPQREPRTHLPAIAEPEFHGSRARRFGLGPGIHRARPLSGSGVEMAR